MLKFTKAAETPESSDRTLMEVDINSIRTNPYQPRKTFNEESIAELALSIRNYGLLQPVSLRKCGEHYEIIAGERRFRACRMLGFTTITAVVASRSEQDSAMLAMIENLQRENLHFFEEAEGFAALMKEHGLTQELLARRLSKNQSTIANKLRLLKLPREIKAKIISGGLSERHARALLRLHNDRAQDKLIDIIVKNGSSVRETEQMVEAEIRRIYDGESGRKKLAYIFRDCRIYVNTIKRAVSQITDAGIDALFDMDENDDTITMTITMKKPEAAMNKRAAAK